MLFIIIVKEINLRIIGLMVIPPNDDNAEKYFKSLNALNKSLALKDMSMGMSAIIEAIKFGSTFIRVGSSIFGSRSYLSTFFNSLAIFIKIFVYSYILLFFYNFFAT